MNGHSEPYAANMASARRPVAPAPPAIHAASRHRSPPSATTGSARSRMPLGLIAAAVAAHAPASSRSSQRRRGASSARADTSAAASARIDIR
jgi:hypothetical protein